MEKCCCAEKLVTSLRTSFHTKGLDAVTAQGLTCVALQLASGHTSVASSCGAEQLDTFCSVHSPTGWQRQGIVMLAWLGTPPTQPAASLPTISVLQFIKRSTSTDCAKMVL